MCKMKVLFIGGTGVISANTALLAKEKGWDVTLLNRGNRSIPDGMHSIVADIRDEHTVADSLKGCSFDVVADFIAYTKEDVERDVRLFKGMTKQYIFVSSTTVYEKPAKTHVITEKTDRGNSFWKYAQNKEKAECYLQGLFHKEGFPVTIVRPSHTYDGKKVPFPLHGHNGNWSILKRMIDGKPVIIPGDGNSLWTFTHSKDFAKGFTAIMGNKDAIGEDFHITSDESMTWNRVFEITADELGKELNAVHVASDFLAHYGTFFDFRGQLLGDKSCTVVFDNSKIKKIAPDFVCEVTMEQGIRDAVRYMLAHKECQQNDDVFDKWCDAIIKAQYVADDFMKNNKKLFQFD